MRVKCKGIASLPFKLLYIQSFCFKIKSLRLINTTYKKNAMSVYANNSPLLRQNDKGVTPEGIMFGVTYK